jgi:poly(3-hydroxybutyrate) depolymerase
MRRHARSLAVLSLLWLAAVPAWAQVATPATWQRIESRSYAFEEAGRAMQYSLFVPSAYDATKTWPLVIALHGLGSTPDQIMRYQGLTDLAEERGYIVAAPMGYNNRGWYGSMGPGRPAIMRGAGLDDPENLGELSEKDVMNVLEIVLGDFNVDRTRVFLMGHSMGGGGTLHLGMKYPDRWAALGAVAPAIYSSPDELEAIRQMPVIVIQGDRDALVGVQGTRRWIAKMRELEMPHSYIEIEGGDHTRLIAADPANMRKIFDFFDQARRN